MLTLVSVSKLLNINVDVGIVLNFLHCLKGKYATAPRIQKKMHRGIDERIFV